MARKQKQQRLIHPLAATEALNGCHTDVSALLMTVQSALSFLTDKSHDPARVRDAITPSLEESLAKVRRWYDEGNGE